MGSLIAQGHADKVEGMVNRALEAKAELVVGGHRPRPPGAYYEPTVLANPDQRSEIVQDEVFGPVVTVQRFSDEEQAMHGRTTSSSASSSSVFTGSIGKAMRVARRLQFGTVWINEHFTLASETPHGGVKESGYGKDGTQVRARGLHGREAHHDQHGRLTIPDRPPASTRDRRRPRRSLRFR